MASAYFKRLENKYGKMNLRGRKYQRMISEILGHNNEKIGKAIARLSSEHYQTSAKALNRSRQKIVKLPDVSDVIPKRSVFMIKGAERGRIISETLRTRLEGDLRNTLAEFQRSGKKKIIGVRGRAAGRMNPELIQSFRDRISKTFESSIKRERLTGIPSNIRNIAVTETRSTISAIKKEYSKKLLEQNPDMRMTKTWIHNRRLSKEPRRTHMKMHGVTVDVAKGFRVQKSKGKGFDVMDRPHDPQAPADQVIGCSCEVVYKAVFP